MAIARLTRVVHFCAAHRYHRPDWSDEENRAAFGACANAPGHGHNYVLAVTVRGPLSEDRSMIMDLAELDRILAQEVVEPLDHHHLNDVVPEFAPGGMIPTVEALAVHLWGRIEARLPDRVDLYAIRVEEDDTLFAEYHGD